MLFKSCNNKLHMSIQIELSSINADLGKVPKLCY